MTTSHESDEHGAGVARDPLEAQALAYARDLCRIAERERQKSQQLAEANERLKSLDRLKSDFLSLISHEMRTPLTSMAMVKLFELETLDPPSRKIAALAQEGYRRLETFVAKVIDYFQSLACEEDWTCATADACEVIDAALRGFGDDGVVSVSGAEGPHVVRGAEQPLTQAIEILLDNVRKHAVGVPRAVLTVQAVDDAVHLVLEDEGCGFPRDRGDEITKPLCPGDVMKHSDGSTLSLALAAQLVERCGGTLTARSEGPGTGATFVVSLTSAVS